MSDSFTPERRSVVVKRRLVSVPRSFLFLVGLIALAPVLVPVALLVDGIRRITTGKPAMTVRLLAFGFVFFAIEAAGLIKLFASWVRAGFGRAGSRMLADAWSIQVWWAQTLLGAVKRIFGLDFVVTGQEVAAPGPIVAMFRHASIVDNLLPAVLLTGDLGIRLRWIVKRELLTLPSLDVAGKRLPNYFVDRASDDPRGELRRIKALGQGLGTDEGVLIYPEGTRFTPQRRVAALERMRSSGDRMLERAERLRHVMPPRLGGTLALLDSGADVVVGAHHGLEGFAKLADLWSGGLVGRTINVRLTRIDAATVPAGRQERAEWLYDVWAEIDDWIEFRTSA